MRETPSEPELTDLPGIGPKTSHYLQKRDIDSLYDLSNERVEELLQIKGISGQKLIDIKREMETIWSYEDVFENTVFLSERIDNSEESLKCERNLVWIEDPREYKYVRETFRWCSTPQKKHSWAVGRGFDLIGYAILHPQTPTGESQRFYRRCFFLKSHDEYESGSPTEAVVPSTVSVGQSGIHPSGMNKTADEYSLSGEIR